MAEIPHFALPFHFVGTAAAVNEQGSTDDVLSCVETIVRFSPGSRNAAPAFGLPDPTFRQGGVNMEAVVDLIAGSEPRARVTTVEDELSRVTNLEDGIDLVRLAIGRTT